MKPARFDYHAPTDLAEAVRLLADLGEQARPLAGGQSLVPLLNMRLARPAAIIDLNRITTLEYHRVEADALVVGALCRHRDIERDAEVGRHCAAISDAVPLIGHVGIRNRGTVVGSLAHADSSAEWPALAVLLEASIRVLGATGERTIPARDFFTGLLSTDLRLGEIVVEARFPWPATGAGSAFVEVARRHGDFALGAAGAVLQIGPDGTVSSARIVFAGFASVPVRADEAERMLLGRPASDTEFESAAQIASEALKPTGDIHAPASYRLALARTLAGRALRLAADRASRDRG